MTSEHDDFWGGSADWPTAQNPIHTDAADATGRTSRTRVTGRHRFSGFLDRGAAPTREHRVVDRAQTAGTPEASDYAYGDDGETFDWDFADDSPPAAGAPDAFEATHATAATDAPDLPETPEWGDEWDVAEPRSRAAMIDPLLARLGAVVVAITLAVPLVLSLRSGSDSADAVSQAESDVPPSIAAPPDASMPEPTAVAESGAAATARAGGGVSPAEDPSTTASSGSAASSTADPPAGADDDAQAASASATVDTAGTVAAAAPSCGLEYEVVAGDFWLRLADGAGVSLDNLLAVNGASTSTALYPGATICLPAGASTPAPPPPVSTAAPATAAPTTAAPTTAAPTTAAPTTAAPTTAAPSTAAPSTATPTTAAPDPTRPPATGSVEQIIRAVWPDELEEKALEIAWRESNHQPDVRNYCCIGLFQIYWEVHQGWLSDLGITTLDHLYDAESNARAAYRLYQRAGGWGPWGG